MIKKTTVLLSIIFLLFLSVCGCSSEHLAPDTDGLNPEQRENAIVCNANGFEMKLFSDKPVYKTTDAIQIWATLEYVGESDKIEIWHGLPYISFSITDGKEFNSDGYTLTILTSTVLEKGQIYHFDYQKNGGWSEDDPNADFWKSFYAEKELLLPEGEYTVSVRGAFSLTTSVTDSHSDLLCELPIKVVR